MTAYLPTPASAADTDYYSFASSTGWEDQHRSSTWPTYYQRPDPARSLTPPPDMHDLSQHATKPTYYQQERGQQYNGYVPNQQYYRASTAPYYPQEVSNADFGRHGVATEPSSRTGSPRQADNSSQQSQRRRGSIDAIVPSLQIPKSVNDSGGSVAELAAQITCLFWFESSDLLQRIEDSTTPLQPPRQLNPDAKPTTGFRKWVTTMLSTTLVAQNVVLLGLLFIYRLKKLNPSVQGKPGSEYRLLTVALMLGNKFLDDNTYTNKTWAEVSGINVNEVHIMEVEFLSNMKYCLFTTADDWTKWQSLVGKFAAFIEQASKPRPVIPLAPILPPASSLRLPMALPSPPASNQASPPYLADLLNNPASYSPANQAGPTPEPSPHVFLPNNETVGLSMMRNSRKRSFDDQATEPPPKRHQVAYQNYQSPLHYAATTQQSSQNQQLPRLPPPHLPTPSNMVSTNYDQDHFPAQLPPINAATRAMAMVYPNTTSQTQMSHIPAPAGPSLQPQSQMPSQYQSRQQSPYAGSAGGSPSDVALLPASTPALQISPTYYLQQRNSPYRPVHNVSTLLYPPPTSALQQQPQSIEYNQMHYQPLGKPIQYRQAGHLPYIAQNQWLGDGNHAQAMTPVHQWPFMNTARRQQLV